ncbi:hypothetical protein CC1G_01184 [Coprinopsis cinerea okayama7|uniref:Ubiquitin-like domain-containing protein n=1 Tax=Coprinopsis cinerea (strain Okayama-7 / 130 / ATCC MYA-4618 / FGSC 9003) TaxID=240176 RepID=A8NET4_COPC7|nr:hypothetical protein CC1G_01184 [Coprinopsis cinerea okayama7\|eukprot:XP_001833122.1 hypothetical protein CC1G_01184 [Coprinopsis cinerea okayama7\
MSKEDKRELRRKAEDEKAKLKHMNNMAFRYFTMPSTEDSCAIIPTRFYTSWKRWIDSPASHDRPDCIDTESLLCAHSMLLYDPGCRVDMDSIITLIRRDEWEILSSFYSTGPPIYVKRTASDNSESSFSELNPGICAECRTLRSGFSLSPLVVTDPDGNSRKINWETTELTIQLGKREDWESSKALGPSASLPVRHSRRLRKKQGDKRKISVTKSTTVKDIKIQISEIFDIPTICQRLFFQGKELADNESTVHDLAIPANDTVFLEQITEAMEIDSDDDSTTRRRVREEGQGFNGTILGGGSFTDSSRASSRAETPTSVLVSSVKSCKACTFDNALGALACEICTTVFE